jgi:hypothetical protein
MVLARTPSGLLLSAPHAGDYLIAGGGSQVLCAPPPETAAWRWQRFLIGQVLPLVAVLRGLEVLHASAVVLGAGAVALCGHSGAGKSSVAAAFLDRGAALLADDVLALEPRGAGVLAHPGPRLMNLRHAEQRVRAAAGKRPPGTTLGEDGKGLRLVVEDRAAPVPLRALCVIGRGSEGRLAIERAVAAAPLLLATTFNFADTSPERLARQLDVHARLAVTATVLRVSIPPGITAHDVATALAAELAAPDEVEARHPPAALHAPDTVEAA